MTSSNAMRAGGVTPDLVKTNQAQVRRARSLERRADAELAHRYGSRATSAALTPEALAKAMAMPLKASLRTRRRAR